MITKSRESNVIPSMRMYAYVKLRMHAAKCVCVKLNKQLPWTVRKRANSGESVRWGREGGRRGRECCDSLLKDVFFSPSEVKLSDTDTSTLHEFPKEERKRERERKRKEERKRGENPCNLLIKQHNVVHTCTNPMHTPHTHTHTHTHNTHTYSKNQLMNASLQRYTYTVDVQKANNLQLSTHLRWWHVRKA